MMTSKKYVLITGISTGIGYNITSYLIKHNYHVIGTVRKTNDVLRLASEFPQNLTLLNVDVTDKDAVTTSFKKVKSLLKEQKLKGLINNAGLAIGGPIELISDEEFRYQMEVNLFAVRHFTNTFLPLLKGNRALKKKGGKIIMISSVSGVFNTPFNGGYCISKHAMESLGEIYRRELYAYDVDVVSIQPGPIQSKLWEKNLNKYDKYKGTSYEKLLEHSNRIMEKAAKEALPASIISKLILKILTKKTSLSYIIIKNKISTLFFIKYLPKRWVDAILYKQLFR